MSLRQLICFGIVGVLAASVNVGVVALLVEKAHWHPLVANILAFVIAYQVSFFGHHYLTFQKAATSIHRAWVKFLSVAVFGFLLNEGLYALFLTVFHVQYMIALVVVLLLVAISTFMLSKYWAFR